LIPLLKNIAGWDRNYVLSDIPEHHRAYALLEWDRTLETIAKYAICRDSVRHILKQKPYTELQPIEQKRELLDQFRGLFDDGQSPPITNISDALQLLHQKLPLRLEGPEIVAIASAANDLDHLREWLIADDGSRPSWASAATACCLFDQLCNRVSNALELDGFVKDSASPLLASLRKNIRKQEQSVRSEVSKIMSRANSKGWTSSGEVTLRGDRFCLPMRSGDRRKVEGLVLDRSGTGGTIFVEPTSVVLLQNDLVEARLSASAEEQRILLELGSLIESHKDDILEAASLQTLLDETFAVLKWSKSVDAVRPIVKQGGRMKIDSARHPLLLKQDPIIEVTPLEFEMPSGMNVILISGPNAGGKSVMLKSVGLMVMLAQCGWDIPSLLKTELPLYKQIFVDLGDEQSIARSLSSYSAHLKHMASFMKLANQDTLVLCDELGSGTDPDEGSVLAYVMLDSLLTSGATVLATTHYGLLKASVNEHPKMINAAMDFDEETLSPMFSIRVGIPGGSHAFDIARRMSLPEDMIDKAVSLLGQDRVQVEKLLTELNTRNRELAESNQRVESKELELKSASKKLKQQLADINKERKKVLAEARAEGERFIKESRRNLELAVKTIKETAANKKSVADAKETLKNISENLPGEKNVKAGNEIAVGEFVEITHLHLDGEVMESRNGRLTIESDGIRMNVNVEDAVVKTRPKTKKRITSAGTHACSDVEAKSEIDLRGLTGEEAWDVVDLFIDRAVVANLAELEIIHGTGTGRLRFYLHDKFSKDVRISSYNHAPLNRGGEGMTILILA
jgi:DNA mismatch repair protein MutS2